jgi:hypothetical protein
MSLSIAEATPTERITDLKAGLRGWQPHTDDSGIATSLR